MPNGQPPARFGFLDRPALMNALQAGHQASDMARLLRIVGHTSPNDRTVARICYSGALMKSGQAMSMLRAFVKFAAAENVQIDEGMFTPAAALVEFNARLPGLGAALSTAMDGPANADLDYAGDIAAHMNITRDVVMQAAGGRCIDLPFAFAQNLAIAAAQVLHKPEPLEVVLAAPNHTDTKPLGGSGLEAGAAPYQCPQTPELRTVVLDWCAQNPNPGNPQPVAA